MQELTFETMIAVFEEMFGAVLFWAMVAAAVLITARLDLRADPGPQPWHAPVPGGAAVHAGRRGSGRVVRHGDDRLAPCRYRRPRWTSIVFLGIAAMGAVGGAILVYTVERLLFQGQRERPRRGVK